MSGSAVLGGLIAGRSAGRTGRIQWRPEEIILLCLAVMKLYKAVRYVTRFDDLVSKRVGDDASKK